MASVFVSYNRDDGDFVQKFARDLRSHSLDVWLDQDELQVGDSLLSSISEGITRSDFLAVVLSRNSVKSRWVKKELDIAMAHELRESHIKVLPVLLEDCDIPSYLADKVYADFRDHKQYEVALMAVVKRVGGESHEVSPGSGVLVVYTGGGIGMRLTDRGVFVPGRMEPVVAAVDLGEDESLSVSYYTLGNPLDSVNIGSSEWMQLAKVIFEQYDKYEGFVIIHGLDTITYTATALAFMLQNLAKPIILTGSRLPINDPTGDGRKNLNMAIRFAASRSLGLTPIRQVAICHGGTILAAIGAEFIGYEKVAGHVLACTPGHQVGTASRFDQAIRAPGRLRLRDKVSTGLVHLIGPTPPEIVDLMARSPGLSAMIMELPGSSVWIEEERPPWIFTNGVRDMPCVVIIDSRRQFDSHGRSYEPVARLLHDGVLFCNHLSLSTLTVKLQWLLAQHADVNVAKRLFVSDIMGEFGAGGGA